MGACEYHVRRADPADVRDGMMRVWSNNLPVDDAAQKYDWFFRDAPETPDAVFVLYAKEESKPEVIVGTISIGIRNFSVRGTMMRIALLADLAVNKEHRQVRFAMAMVRAAKKYALEHQALLFGFPNRRAVGVFRRGGCTQIGSMPRFARVLRHAGYIDRLAEHDRMPDWAAPLLAKPGVRTVLGAAADAARLSEIGLRLASAARRYELAWLETNDSRIDELWAACKHHYQIVGERSAAFIAWRFPVDEGHRIAALVDHKSGEMRAYAVLLREGSVEHVRDFFGFPIELGPLFYRLVPKLYREGATSMSVRFLGAPWATKMLTSAGFVERQGARDIIVDAIDGISVGEVGDWFLCDSDEDA